MLTKLEKKRRSVSDKLVQYVDIVFGVAVGQSIIRYINLIQNPLLHLFASTALLLVILTVGLSWVGYHKSMYEFPYKADNLSFHSLEKSVSILRPFTDFLIVVVYIFLLFTIDGLQQEPAGINLFTFIASYVLFFTLYIIGGVFRIIEYKDRDASRLEISRRYWLGYLFILGLYFDLTYGLTHIAPQQWLPFLGPINWLFLLACAFFNLRYRRDREPHYKPNTPFNKRKLTVVVDVDGVLADQVTPVLEELNRRHGSSYVKKDIRHWDEPLPLAHTDIKTAIESSHQNPDFVKSMNPIENASEVVRELSKYLEVFIATNRTSVADQPTREWLKSNNIPYDSYHNTSLEGKGVIQGDIIIDDYPKNVLEFTAKPNRVGILFAQPWNENDTSLIGKNNIFRAKGWLEVWKKIDDLDPLPF